MPNDTFFNLPEEKRNMIEVVAIDEFAEYGFDKASINRITVACSIAKGSFYQYFEDKKDLFKHLMTRAVEEKMKFMSPIMLNPSAHDIFTLIREMYVSGLKYANANPKLVVIGNRLLKDKDHPIHKEVLGKNMAIAYQFFEGLVRAAIERGEVRPDIDVKFAGYMIYSMNVATIEYYQDIIHEGDEYVELDEKIMDTVNVFLDFIKNGVGVNQKGGI